MNCIVTGGCGFVGSTLANINKIKEKLGWILQYDLPSQISV